MELLLPGVDLGGDRVNALAVVTTEFVCGGGIVLTFGFFLFHLLLFEKKLGGEKRVICIGLARTFLIVQIFNELYGKTEDSFVIRSSRRRFTNFGEMGSKGGDKGEVVVIKNFVCGFSNEGWISRKETSEDPSGGGKLPDPANPRMPVAVVDFITRKNSEMITVDEELIGIGDFTLF